MKPIYNIWVILLLSQALPTFSQKETVKPLAAGSSVFTDNQSGDVPENAPSKWKVASGKCVIQSYDGENVISLPGDETKIIPRTDVKSLLSKGFDASFELFYTEHGGQRYYCRLTEYRTIEFKQNQVSFGNSVSDLPITDVTKEPWQKIRIVFESKQIKVFVNDHAELIIQDVNYIPDQFSLENWQTGSNPYYIRNISIKGSGSQAQQLTLIFPANHAKVIDKNLSFSWKSLLPAIHSKFIVSIFEMKPGQTAADAVKGHPCYRKAVTGILSAKYLIASKSIQRNRNFCWNVKQIIGADEYLSEPSVFTEISTTPLKFPEAKASCDTNGTVRSGDPCKIIITELKGEVDVRLPGGDFEPATPGMELPAGATIVTGTGGGAVVAFGTNSVALVRETTMFRIDKWECPGPNNEAKAEVFIDPGVCHVSVKQLEQFKTDFRVSTPRLTCGGRG